MAGSHQGGFVSYPLEYPALGLLMDGPRHGYRLYQDFNGALRGIWKAGQAKFYAALASLETGGLLDSQEEPQQGRPPRRVYTITPEGRAEFLAWLHAPVPSLRAIRVELIGKLRFFDLLDLPGAHTLVDRQVALLENMLAEWAELSVEQGLSDADPFPALTDDFRRRQAHFLIDWLRAWRDRLPDAPARPTALTS